MMMMMMMIFEEVVALNTELRECGKSQNLRLISTQTAVLSQKFLSKGIKKFCPLDSNVLQTVLAQDAIPLNGRPHPHILKEVHTLLRVYNYHFPTILKQVPPKIIALISAVLMSVHDVLDQILRSLTAVSSNYIRNVCIAF